MLKIAEGIFVGKANVLFFLVSFLVGSQKEMNRRKWAAEGLSFLTMDADVKVKLIPLHISFLIVLPRDRSLFAQPIRTRKAQSKSPHAFAHLVNSQKMCPPCLVIICYYSRQGPSLKMGSVCS